MELTQAPPATLPALLQSRAKAEGAATILRRKDRGIWKTTSWAALADRVRGIGLALGAEGIGAGTAVGLLADTRPEWVEADLAVMGMGGVSVGLPLNESDAELSRMLHEAGCRLVFVENEEQLDKVLAVRADLPALGRIVIFDMTGLRELNEPGVLSLDAFIAAGERADPSSWAQAVARLQPGDRAAIIQTAGTTGPAKAVALSHRTLLAQAAAAAAALGQGPQDERLAFSPLSHVLERTVGLYASLVAGSVSNFVENAETVADNLREVQPTVLGGPPWFWQRLRTDVLAAMAEASPIQRAVLRRALAAGGRREANTPPLTRVADWITLRPVRQRTGLDGVRVAFSAGAPLPPDLVAWYQALGVTLRDAYVVTECAGLVALRPPLGPASTELRVLPSGEVTVRGPQAITTGAEDGWIATDDIGVLDGDGLRILGRKGEMVGTQEGRPVPAGTIEAALLASPYIADAIIALDASGSLLATLLPNDQELERWARDQGLGFTGFAALVRAEEVRSLMRNEVARINTGLPPGQQLRDVNLVERRIRSGDPRLTAAMRLRRGQGGGTMAASNVIAIPA